MSSSASAINLQEKNSEIFPIAEIQKPCKVNKVNHTTRKEEEAPKLKTTRKQKVKINQSTDKDETFQNEQDNKSITIMDIFRETYRIMREQLHIHDKDLPKRFASSSSEEMNG